MIYYAHSLENEKEENWQTIKDHSINVGKLVEKFSNYFCIKEYANNLGRLHDIGKYQCDFQRRIRGEPIEIEHSICGAKEWLKLGFMESGSYCIAGHHTGLPDIGFRTDGIAASSLYGRIRRETDDYNEYKKEIDLAEFSGFPSKKSVSFDLIKSNTELVKKEYAFWTRMMFSCLVDADYLDSEAFSKGIQVENLLSENINTIPFSELKNLITDYINKFENNTEVRKARSELRNQLVQGTNEDAKIYSLNMPTGSGKTLASMEFALTRAIKSNKKRIIYIIPYTSIIEQNAKVLKNILGEDVVLEHHSDVSYSDDKDDIMKKKTENWDAQIIVTTNIQFFKSIYGNKGSQLRRLHNITESIIIFDEIHMLPLLYYKPCLEAIRFLVDNYGCEALFMSATMPDFKKYLNNLEIKNDEMIDLIKDKSNYSKFERCEIVKANNLSITDFIGITNKNKNTLIIVNTKKSAKILYDNIQCKKYHLSTYMTHFDRDYVLNNVKKSLKNKEHFCLISTSLIEAGVDLDFDFVYRENSGIDNILQSAGRCNREGKKQNCKTFVFSFEDDLLTSRNEDMQKKSYFTDLTYRQIGSFQSENAIQFYYNLLFDYSKNSIESEKDFSKYITSNSLRNEGIGFKFLSYSEEFKYIDENSKAVLIITQENKEEIEQIFLQYNNRVISKKIQKYIVSLRQYEFDDLWKKGVLVEINNYYCINSELYYKKETGVCFDTGDLVII